MNSPAVDVLVPTCDRPPALAATLTAVMAQRFADYRVVVSDQGTGAAADDGTVRTVVRLLRLRGVEVEIHRHLPRRGLAEQRDFLLSRATTGRALFLDDDVLLEPDVLGRMVRALDEHGCGFVGMPLIGLSYVDDVRPDEQRIELWGDEGVQPEVVRPGSPEWGRWPLHNAANVLHVQQRLGLGPDDVCCYKVAWVGGCVLYDSAKLRDCGGFGFWRELPENHSGEDVVAQQRVMARYGGCGVLPSGAYHQELPTTIPDRSNDAPHLIPIATSAATPS